MWDKISKKHFSIRKRAKSTRRSPESIEEKFEFDLRGLVKALAHIEGPKCSGCYLQAAREGRLVRIIEQISQGVDIHCTTDQGSTALHLAVMGGYTDIIEELLQRGCNINAITNNGYTVLHIACLKKNLDMVKMFMERGCDVNARTKQGFTPLYISAQENDLVTAEHLLTNGASQNILSMDGFTPLMIALQQGHDNMVSLLLEHDPIAKEKIASLRNPPPEGTDGNEIVAESQSAAQVSRHSMGTRGGSRHPSKTAVRK